MAGQQDGQQLTVQEQRQRRFVSWEAMVTGLEGNLAEVQPKGGDVAKLKRMALTAVQKNMDLLDCNRESWITALQLCAQDGLMPDGREAAFVKFKDTVQYMPMVYGLRKKMLQSGEIRDIFTAVVYQAEFEAELFEVTLGSDPKIVHRPLLGMADRGPIIAAYSVATYKDGTRSFEVMTTAEIEKVRMVSQTGKKNEGPWRDWYGEMARKTVLRRHSKSLPMSSDLRDVEIEHMFDPSAFARTIAPNEEQRGLAGGPARSSQLGRSATAGRLDDIEDRVGAQVEVEPQGGKLDNGEIVDRETGEVIHRGNESTAKPAAENPQASETIDDEVPHQNAAIDEKRKQAEREDDNRKAKAAAAQPAVEEKAKPAEMDPNEAKRKEIIALYRGAANVIDLRRYRDEHQATVDAMDEENAGAIAKAFNDSEAKLRGGAR